MKDRDKEMLVPMLRDCPPEKLKRVVERNYKARMPGGGWVSPLDTSSIDMEAVKDYLEQARKNQPESEVGPVEEDLQPVRRAMQSSDFDAQQ